MSDLTQSQSDILKELNSRMSSDSLQFSSNQRLVIGELNKRIKTDKSIGFGEAIGQQIIEGVDFSGIQQPGLLSRTTPMSVPPEAGGMFGQLLLNAIDLPQDIAVAGATTDKFGKPLEETFSERVAKGRDPSDVIDVGGDINITLPKGITTRGILPFNPFQGQTTTLPISRGVKETVLNIVADPINLTAIGSIIKEAKIGSKILSTFKKTGKINRLDIDKLKKIDDLKNASPKEIVDAVRELLQKESKTFRKPKNIPEKKIVDAIKQIPARGETGAKFIAKGKQASMKEIAKIKNLRLEEKVRNVNILRREIDRLIAATKGKGAKAEKDIAAFIGKQKDINKPLAELSRRARSGADDAVDAALLKDMIKQKTGKAKAVPEITSKKIVDDAPTQAKKAEKVFDEGDIAFEKKSKRTIKQRLEATRRNVVDQSGNIKAKLINESGDLGKEVVMHKDLMAGAHPKAVKQFEDSHKIIYSKLDAEEIKTLDRIISSRRGIAVLDSKSGIKRPLSKEEYQSYLNSLPKETLSKLQPIADEWFEIPRRLTKELKKEGLLTQAQVDALNKIDYAPSQFIQHVDPKVTYDIGGRKISVHDSGIKTLDKGSEQALETNSRLLMNQMYARVQARIFRNRANQAALKLARENPKNGIFTEAKITGRTKDGQPIFGKPPSEHQQIFVMEKGQRKALNLPDEMAIEWVQRDPVLSSGAVEAIGWFSGAKVLKAMATGLNPEFAIGNLPRDIAHAWLTTNEYSTFLPKALGEITKDYSKVLKDAVFRKGRYTDYINDGGGMEFLTHQGQITNKIGPGFLNGVQKIMGYLGETSEILTRLALRERAISNGKSAQEATWIARNYLDFSQGGRYAKAVDSGVPYLNAAIQGTRGIFRAAKTNPKTFTAKVAQITGLSMGLYYANKTKNPEAYAQISPREKINNWIITTPFQFTDKDGDKRYFYFRIPKDQGQRAMATIFEGLAMKMNGEEVDSGMIIESIKDAIPIMPTNLLPPTLDALIGYAANVDFWRQENIWKGAKVESFAEKTGRTNEFFSVLGEKTGASPIRMERAVEQFFTSGNIWTSLVGEGWELAMRDMSDREKEQVTEEVILKQPFVRKFLRATRPFEEFKETIESEKIKTNTSRHLLNLELEKTIKQFEANKIKRSDIFSNIRKLDIPRVEKERLFNRAKKSILWKDLPEKRYWLNLSALSPEAGANVFYQRWFNKVNERKELMRTIGRLGIASDRFKNTFSQLKTKGAKR